MNEFKDDKTSNILTHNEFISILSELSTKWLPDGEGILDLSIYRCVGIDQAQITKLLNEIFSSLKISDTKLSVSVLYMEEFAILYSYTELRPHPENTTILTTSQVINNGALSGPGLMFVTPSKDGTSEGLHRQNILPIIAILRMHFGIAISWEAPHNMRFNSAKKNLWHAMTIGRHYNPNTDGPFIRDSFNDEIISILNKVHSITKSKDTIRVSVALELLCEAGNCSSSLTRTNVINYWSAIEYLCDTNSEIDLKKIIFRKSMYSHPTCEALFKKARVLRHNIVHKGHSNQTSVDLLERYLNLVFLDALNYILELPPQYYLEQFIQKHGDAWLNEVYR